MSILLFYDLWSIHTQATCTERRVWAACGQRCEALSLCVWLTASTLSVNMGFMESRNWPEAPHYTVPIYVCVSECVRALVLLFSHYGCLYCILLRTEWIRVQPCYGWLGSGGSFSQTQEEKHLKGSGPDTFGRRARFLCYPVRWKDGLWFHLFRSEGSGMCFGLKWENICQHRRSKTHLPTNSLPETWRRQNLHLLVRYLALSSALPQFLTVRTRWKAGLMCIFG